MLIPDLPDGLSNNFSILSIGDSEINDRIVPNNKLMMYEPTAPSNWK